MNELVDWLKIAQKVEVSSCLSSSFKISAWHNCSHWSKGQIVSCEVDGFWSFVLHFHAKSDSMTKTILTMQNALEVQDKTTI